MEEVIERAQQGDADALGMLWRTYQHMLLRYFRAKRMAHPEDLASLVWVEVATSLHRFEGAEHEFRRWLFTIAARRRIDEIRSSNRREEIAREELPPRDQLVAPSAADDAERAASLDRALELVGELPPDQREAVILRVIGDLSVTDVAMIMSRREGAVRVLVHRGLKRLAESDAVTKQRSRTMSST